MSRDYIVVSQRKLLTRIDLTSSGWLMGDERVGSQDIGRIIIWSHARYGVARARI